MDTTARGARASYAVPLAAAAGIVLAIAVGAALLQRPSDSNVGVGTSPSASPTLAPQQSPSPPGATADPTARAEPPRTTLAFDTVPVDQPFEIAAGESAIWATSGADVVRIDPGTLDQVRIPLAAAQLSGIVAAPSGAWAADYGASRVYRIDPATNQLAATIELGSGPRAIAEHDGRIYVADASRTYVIDPATNEVVDSFDRPGVFGHPVAFESIWYVANDSIRRLDLSLIHI